LALTSGFLLIIFGVRIIYKNIENHRLAYTDGLTNTNNRAAVDIKFKELDNKYKSNITIVSFDLNNFKYVNDNFGHHIGDELLIKFAGILQETLGSIGFVGRMGGDEFIEKPFDLNVVTAKVQAVLRRAYALQGTANIIEHGEMLLNLGDASLTIAGQKIELTKNEFKICQMFFESAGKFVTRDAIMTRLWESDEFIDDNTLTVNVARLRKKLEEAGMHDVIRTKKGIGYMLV